MSDASEKIRADALRIWHAGLNAVRSDRLMHNAIRVEGRTLLLGNDFLGLPEDALRIDLNTVKRIAVVGAGKAGTAWPPPSKKSSASPCSKKNNSPAGLTCPPIASENSIAFISTPPAPLALTNLPKQASSAQEILRIVESLGPDDLCIALISGGGSALLPAPIGGISLADKLAVTKFLSAAGANIAELNMVRKQLSRIKGGGLARAAAPADWYRSSFPTSPAIR